MRSQLSVISDIKWLLMTDAQSNLVDIPPLLLIMPKQNASSRAVLYSIALVIMKKSRRRGGGDWGKGVMNASPPQPLPHQDLNRACRVLLTVSSLGLPWKEEEVVMHVPDRTFFQEFGVPGNPGFTLIYFAWIRPPPLIPQAEGKGGDWWNN